MNRRQFLKKTAIGGLATSFSNLPLELLSGVRSNDIATLCILHTNDTHSRIDPFPEGSKYAGLGGVARRAALIKQYRNAYDQVLLLDAGDIFQGTPYFNMFGGELEFKLMSKMGYDAATLGNHDFDAGIEGLVKQMPHASFSFLNCNYNVKNTPLKDIVFPYKVIKKGELNIGLIGVGIELEGLVPSHLFGEVIYLDPIEHVNATAKILKKDVKCDLVICLSHLGLKYSSKKISDVILAQESENVDIIIGGHTHTFLDKAMLINNLNNLPVVVNQVGWAGINLGVIKVVFKKYSKNFRPVISTNKTIVK